MSRKMGTKEKISSLCTMKKSRTRDTMAVRNSVMWETCTATQTMVVFGPMLLQRAMSVSMTLPKQGSVSLSVAHVTTKDHEDIPPWSGLPPEAMVTSGPMLPPGTMSGSVILWLPGSVLIIETCVTTKGHVAIHGMCCFLNHVDVQALCRAGPTLCLL